MATATNQTQTTVETEAERRARIKAKIAAAKAERDAKMAQPGKQQELYNPITDVTTNSYPEGGKDAIGDPAKQERDLADSLMKDGYSSEKAAELAKMLLLNASKQPAAPGGNVQNAIAHSISAGSVDDPADIAHKTFEDANASGIGIGNTEATTREVTEEELVSTQLGALIDENSAYIKRAKQRAMELANQRGSFGSSFAAGAAQRAAVDAALPIATADAQAYRDAATQNMNALNEFALANLQRATQIDLSLLDANTRIDMANLDASVRVSLANLDALTQTNIANLDAQTRTSLGNLQAQTQMAVQKMQSELSLTMQSREMTHQVGMEQLQQTGRVDLAKLDIGARMALQEAGFLHDFDMNNLDHEQQLQVNEILQGYELTRLNEDWANKRRSEHANLAMQAQMNYINYLTAYANTDMDHNAAQRLQEDARNNLRAELDMINGLYSEFDPISFGG